MATRLTAWIAGCSLLASACSMSAMADDGPFGLYNPLGIYAGAGLGRADIDQTQFDSYSHDYHHLDGEPLGWNAVVGIRPIPFLGAEAEFLDFGNSRLHAFPAEQFLGSESHDRAAAAFAVGYLPTPLPFLEPFAKLGWAQIWQRDSFPGAASESSHPSGVAYGGGLQFHFAQLAVRAEYERISGSRSSVGGWNDPSLLSVGLNWTF